MALALSLVARALSAQTVDLSSPLIQVTIDRGTIHALQESPSEPNLLRTPVRVEITSGTAAPITEEANTLESLTALSRRAAAERSSETEELSWRHEWDVSNGTLAIRTTFKNLSSARRCVGISWRFIFTSGDYKPFFSGSFLTPEWPASGVSWYSYLTDRRSKYPSLPNDSDAHRLNMPLWCIYNPDRNIGVTLAADFDSPILPFEVRAEHIGLPPPGPHVKRWVSYAHDVLSGDTFRAARFELRYALRRAP